MGRIGKRTVLASFAFLALLAASVVFVVVLGQEQSIPMPDESLVELTVEHEGTTYKLIDGDLYRVSSPGQIVFVEKLYDTDFLEENYTQHDGQVFRIDTDTGKQYPTRRHFEAGFEDANRITDLIGEQRGWTSFTLQSPSSPTVPEYVELRKRILREGADFVDNRVEPSSEIVHTGSRALKCYSLAPTPRMVCAKASLSTELLHFVKGDDVWFSGWYFVPEGEMPLTLMDLESTWIKEHPGMRIMVKDGAAMFELKWATKPEYRQPKANRVEIPVGRWFHLQSCFHLSEKPDGRVELWQDGEKLIDQQGQTLPLAGAIYNSLEVGISAHSFGPASATVYVDDVVVSDKPVD
jgi:hypothetical protein